MKISLIIILCLAVNGLYAQYPSSCGSINSRNNSNGQANSCAGVSGTPVAPNFVNTAYNSVPAGAKTADITLKYINTDYTTLLPYAITRISHIVGGVTTILNSPVGPAGVPELSGSNDALVKYCVYISNIPTSGTISFQLTNPETGVGYASCFYDANCTSNCNSTGFVLPVVMNSLKARKTTQGILLEWSTENENLSHIYQIERSTDGNRFNILAEKQAVSNSSASYNYLDQSPKSGINYYRIKQLNVNGNNEYTNIIQVKNTDASIDLIKVSNPFINHITIDLTTVNAELVNLRLLEINGKAIANKNLKSVSGTNIISLENLSGVSKGIYILEIRAGSMLLRERLIK